MTANLPEFRRRRRLDDILTTLHMPRRFTREKFHFRLASSSHFVVDAEGPYWQQQERISIRHFASPRIPLQSQANFHRFLVPPSPRLQTS